MASDPTAAEIARAKRWASLQNPPVTVEPYGPSMFQLAKEPKWLKDTKYRCMSEDIAWGVLVLALRPIFASLAPVLFEEAAKHMDDCASLSSNPHMIQAYQHAAFSLRRLAAGETTC